MKKNKNNFRQGAAMFIVIASVFIFTMLAFLGLQLSNRDNALSGDLLEIKSQRLSAIAGLNLAVSQLSLAPVQTVKMLQKFQDDPNYKWIDLGDKDGFSLTNEKPIWFNLQNSSSTGFATRVEILGVGLEVVNGSLPIVLHAYGLGRNGEVFEVQGTYGIRGLSQPNTNIINGPDQAFLARGGFGHLNSNIESDAGVYIGGIRNSSNNDDMIIQGSNLSIKIKKFKTNGNLFIERNIQFTGTAFVNGNIRSNDGATAIFEDNVIVKNGISGGLNGTINALKSFYLFGPNSININANISVGDVFWVRDLVWNNGKSLTVGTPTKDGVLRLDKGIADYNDAKIKAYGNMDVGGALSTIKGVVSTTGDLNFYSNGSSNDVSIDKGELAVDKDLYVAGFMSVNTDKKITIKGNAYINNYFLVSDALSIDFSNDLYVRNYINVSKVPLNIFGRSYIGGSSSFSSSNPIFGGDTYLERSISLSKSTATFNGRSVLNNGVNSASKVFGLVFNHDSWWNATSITRWYDGDKARFSGNLSLNGSLSPDFTNEFLSNGIKATPWVFGPNKTLYANTNKSPFPGSFAFLTGYTPSLTRVANSDLDKSIFFGEILKFPEYKTKERATLSDDPTELIKLGFDQEQLQTDPDQNPASDVFLSKMKNENSTIFVTSKWKNLYEKYRKFEDILLDNYNQPLSVGSKAPTGDQLRKIYEYESANKGTESSMYQKFLVITIEDDDFKYLQSFNDVVPKKIPSGANILWNIQLKNTSENDWNIFGKWYSSDEGTVQIVYSKSTLNEFGWAGNFYGFIYMDTPNPGTMKSDPTTPSVLWGAWEIADKNAVYANANSGAGFVFWRKKEASVKALDVIKSSFSKITVQEKIELERITDKNLRNEKDPRIIIFNGDRDLNNIKFDIQMQATQGWIQVDRWGEYR